MMSNDSSGGQYYPGDIDIFSEESITITITYICLGILTLIGNFMVCYLYAKSHSLRTLTNRFVISSSIAGLLVGLLFVPFYLVLDAMTQAVSTLAMPVSGFIASLTGFAMLFNVAALTYDRHIAIFRPLRYNELMTKKKTNFILAAVWIVPFILSATPMLLAKTIKSPEKIALCFKIYQGFLSTLLCVVISIVFAIYLRIAILTRKHLQAERRESRISVKSDISQTFKNCFCCSLSKNVTRPPTICLEEEILTLEDLNLELSKQIPEKDRKISLIQILNHANENYTESITAANTRRNSQALQPCLNNLDTPSRKHFAPDTSRCRKTSAITNDEFQKTYTPRHRKLSLDVAKFRSKNQFFLENEDSNCENESIESPMTYRSSRVSFQTSSPFYSPISCHESRYEQHENHRQNSRIQEAIARDEIDKEEVDETACRTPLLRRQQRIRSEEFEKVFRNLKYSPDVQRYSTRRKEGPEKCVNQRVLYTVDSNEGAEVKLTDECVPLNKPVEKAGSSPCTSRVSIQENNQIVKPNSGSFEHIKKPKLKPKIKAKSLSLTKKSGDKPSRRHTLTAINFFGSNRNIGLFSRLRKQFSSSSTKEFVSSDGSRSFSVISDWIKKRSSSTNVFAQARVFLHEIRVAKVLAIIFVINSLCWMPLIFINFADAFGESDYISEELLMASQLLFMINALVMPYVYAFCKKDFKQALKKQFRIIYKETIKFY